MSHPSVAVIVPTYHRAHLLNACLTALGRQTLAPDEVWVALRPDDHEAQHVVSRHTQESSMVRHVVVQEAGVLAAMRAAVGASSAEIVAFTDDDAQPAPQWLAGLVSLLSLPGVGGAGGRDLIPGQTSPVQPLVGVFTAMGRPIGNHHLGTGPVREVVVLKGVNMAFRAEALALPGPGVLRGRGAEVHFEFLVCQWARRQGWRLLYDPTVTVHHEGAPRLGADQRTKPHRAAVFDAAHNYLVAASVVDDHRGRILANALLVGSRGEPSLVRALAGLPRGETEVLRRLLPSLGGKAKALATSLGTPGRARAAMIPANRLRGRAKPRVALVAHDIHDRGGMERALAQLIRRTCQQIDYVVVSASLSEELRPLVQWRRVRTLPAPFPLKFAAFYVNASRALARLSVDLVHTTGAIVVNRVDAVTVHYCHAGFRAVGGFTSGDGPLLRRLNSRVSRGMALAAERWTYRAAKARVLAAVSEGVAAELARYYPTVPVAITPNGVDADRFRPDPQARSQERSAAGLAPGCVVALFVGGEWHRKGLAHAIEGLALARQAGAEALRLWVLGRGDQARFSKLAESHGVAQQVRFLGFRADAQRLYQAADIFVLPTLYEAMPLVAYEAAASGLPVVCTRCHGVAELVGNDEAGLLVERSSQAVGEALARLTLHPGLRQAMAEQARARSGAYTWQRSAQSVLQLYDMLLGHGVSPAPVNS